MAADFGHAGNLTVRKSREVVQVKISKGEHLHFKIKVSGATTIFNLSCGHDKTLWSEADFPRSSHEFERTWPRDEGEVDAAHDVLTLAVSFATALSYTLVIELQDVNHRVISVLNDLDCSSEDARDTFELGMTVFSV